VLAEHAFVGEAVAAIGTVDAVVVLDPPSTAAQRDALAQLPPQVSLHLSFSAAEARFASDVRAAELDVRGTFAPAWRVLREHPGLAGDDLEAALLGRDDSAFLHSPEALRIAIASLAGKGLLEPWPGDGLAVAAGHAAAART
jgi:hypothetical protein